MKTTDSQLQRTFYLMGSLVLSAGFLYWARSVLIPVTVALLLMFILAPIVTRMERSGTPRFLASTIAVGAVALLLIGIGYVFTLQVRSLTSEIPTYRVQIAEKITSLRQATQESWIGGIVDFANELVEEPGENTLQEPKAQPNGTRFHVSLMPVLQSVAGTAAEVLFNAGLIMVLAVLMLQRREDLRNRLIHLLGTDNVIGATRTMDEAGKRISRFLLSQLIVNIGFGIVVAWGLFFIGIPYPYVWGALAGVLRYIPFLGGFIAAAFPLLASLVMPDWTPFFWTAIFFLVVEVLQANLVEPQVFGHSIGISGAMQLIAVLFWGYLWGPVGLILSTPLTACVCVLGRRFAGLGFIATLIGDEEIVEKPVAFYQRLVAGDSDEATDLAEEFAKEHAIPVVCDQLLVPALLSAESDQRHGDLSREDRVSITEAVRDIFLDTVASQDAASHETEPVGDRPDVPILVPILPLHDETDELIVEMLKSTSTHGRWTSATAKDIQLEETEEPTLVLLGTARRKNIVRLRGMCKSMRTMFPDAKILVGCWSLENGADQISRRLKDAGATAVCTSFLQARQFIDEALVEPSERLQPVH